MNCEQSFNLRGLLCGYIIVEDQFPPRWCARSTTWSHEDTHMKITAIGTIGIKDQGICKELCGIEAGSKG